MFNNLIGLDDARRAIEKVRQGYGHRLLRLLRPSASDHRVRDAWQHVDSPPRSWADVPDIRKMWNERVSGNPEIPFREYIAERFLSDADGVHAISIGCGSGANEVRWMRTGRFSEIIGLDISPERVASAQSRAKDEGFIGGLRFRVDDARNLDFPADSLDVVIAESALHHMSPLEPMVAEIRRVLKPGGVVILRDFVGPSRFQWTRLQLDLTQALLQTLPRHLRVRARKWIHQGTVLCARTACHDPLGPVGGSGIVEDPWIDGGVFRD